MPQMMNEPYIYIYVIRELYFNDSGCDFWRLHERGHGTAYI